MDNKNKLGTLDSMTKESFTARPEQAPDAVNEYLENLDSNEVAMLEKKLENASYKEQFKIAITHTSLMVFIAAYKATQPDEEVEFDQYIREYLFFARQDDSDIYNMRLFYLNNLDSDQMEIGDNNINDEDLTPVEEALVRKENLRAKREYDSMINNLTTQYQERSIHLID